MLAIISQTDTLKEHPLDARANLGQHRIDAGAADDCINRNDVETNVVQTNLRFFAAIAHTRAQPRTSAN